MVSTADRQRLLEPTVMAMREQIMEYFKGTCVERVTTGSNIHLVNKQISFSGMFRYERTHHERNKAKYMLIGNTPFAILESDPKTMTILTTAADRSPQFRAIKRRIIHFSAEFLPGIKVKQSVIGV